MYATVGYIVDYIGECIPYGERMACVTFILFFIIIIFTTLHGQPHGVFGGFISMSGCWLLLRTIGRYD